MCIQNCIAKYTQNMYMSSAIKAIEKYSVKLAAKHKKIDVTYLTRAWSALKK